MGVGGIGPMQLIIVLVIVLLLFGTKKLRNLGGDLGGEAGVGTSRKVDYTSMFLAMASRMPEPPDFRELLLLPESND